MLHKYTVGQKVRILNGPIAEIIELRRFFSEPSYMVKWSSNKGIFKERELE